MKPTGFASSEETLSDESALKGAQYFSWDPIIAGGETKQKSIRKQSQQESPE